MTWLQLWPDLNVHVPAAGEMAGRSQHVSAELQDITHAECGEVLNRWAWGGLTKAWLSTSSGPYPGAIQLSAECGKGRLENLGKFVSTR